MRTSQCGPLRPSSHVQGGSATLAPPLASHVPTFEQRATRSPRQSMPQEVDATFSYTVELLLESMLQPSDENRQGMLDETSQMA